MSDRSCSEKILNELKLKSYSIIQNSCFRVKFFDDKNSLLIYCISEQLFMNLFLFENYNWNSEFGFHFGKCQVPSNENNRAKLLGARCGLSER